MPVFSLEKKNIVITGACGHLGLEQTKSLVEGGSVVLALCRNSSSLEDLAKQNENLVVKKIDLRNEKSVESTIRDFCGDCGPIDGLVNNAYFATKGVNFYQSKKQILEELDSSFVQYWTTSRIAIKYFEMKKGGSIVNCGSLFGNLSPNLSMYLNLKNEPSMSLVAAKGAVHQITKYMAAMLAERNIRVNTLVPGFFPKKRGADSPEYIEQIVSRLCIKRIGSPKDLLGPITFLLSDASNYMTGSELTIDGGYSIL